MLTNNIFLFNFFILLIILFLINLVGQVLKFCFSKVEQNIFTFLRPTLGLAIFVLIATYLGHTNVGFIHPWICRSILLILAVIGFSFIKFEKDFWQHTSIFSLFGLFCAIPFFIQLYLYGGYNAHNDTFTYLAISDWLQTHLFINPIQPSDLTPANTQVHMYQTLGFRMGAIHYFAFFQSLFNIKWSYLLYPSIAIVPVTTCLWSMGSVLIWFFPEIKKVNLYLILLIPAYGLGGLIFGSFYGFMPQTFGLALGSISLFLMGFNLYYLQNEKIYKWNIFRAIPLSICLSSLTIAYCEFSIFILIIILLTHFISFLFISKIKRILLYLLYTFIFTGILINIQFPRIIHSIKTQAGAIVGGPVDWPLLGFIFHMFGIHGGAWDCCQWLLHKNTNLDFFGIILIFLMILYTIYLFIHFRIVNKKEVVLIPIVSMIYLLFFSLLYFRYFAHNPFPYGKGQSWSQFKLANWTYPFTSIIILFIIAFVNKHYTKNFILIITSILCVELSLASYLSIGRMRNIESYYNHPKSLYNFYTNIREKITTECPNNAYIYLDLMGGHYKFREMISIFLFDKKLKSNWEGDGYIFNTLSKADMNQKLSDSDCYVTVNPVPQIEKDFILISKGTSTILNNLSYIGAYEEEKSGKDRFQWINKEVVYKYEPLFASSKDNKTKIYFAYDLRISQSLTIKITTTDKFIFLKIPKQNKLDGFFEKELDFPLHTIREVKISGDEFAFRLSDFDNRLASWRILNYSLTSVEKI